MSRSKYGENIILFPIEYNRRGDPSYHSVKGRTLDGEIINIKLRIDPTTENNSDYIPSIEEFARDDRKANLSCIASKTNKKSDREGMLLFTQCHLETDAKNSKSGIASYVAKWASVIASDSSSPDPYITYGRMEARRNPELVRELERARAMDDEKTIAKLEQRIIDPENLKYPTVLYYPADTVIVAAGDIDSFKNIIPPLFNKYRKRGVTFGIMVRKKDYDGKVIKQSYAEYFQLYIKKENRYQDEQEFIDKILENANLLNDKYDLDVMPIIKINQGQTGVKFYSEGKKYNRLRQMYYDSNSDPIICKVVARVNYVRDTDSTFLYRLHSVSQSLGHPAKLSKHGLLDLSFSGENDYVSNVSLHENQLNPKHNGHLYSDVICEFRYDVSNFSNIEGIQTPTSSDNSYIDGRDLIDSNNLIPSDIVGEENKFIHALSDYKTELVDDDTTDHIPTNDDFVYEDSVSSGDESDSSLDALALDTPAINEDIISSPNTTSLTKQKDHEIDPLASNKENQLPKIEKPSLTLVTSNPHPEYKSGDYEAIISEVSNVDLIQDDLITEKIHPDIKIADEPIVISKPSPPAQSKTTVTEQKVIPEPIIANQVEKPMAEKPVTGLMAFMKNRQKPK